MLQSASQTSLLNNQLLERLKRFYAGKSEISLSLKNIVAWEKIWEKWCDLTKQNNSALWQKLLFGMMLMLDIHSIDQLDHFITCIMCYFQFQLFWSGLNLIATSKNKLTTGMNFPRVEKINLLPMQKCCKIFYTIFN